MNVWNYFFCCSSSDQFLYIDHKREIIRLEPIIHPIVVPSTTFTISTQAQKAVQELSPARIKSRSRSNLHRAHICPILSTEALKFHSGDVEDSLTFDEDQSAVHEQHHATPLPFPHSEAPVSRSTKFRVLAQPSAQTRIKESPTNSPLSHRGFRMSKYADTRPGHNTCKGSSPVSFTRRRKSQDEKSRSETRLINLQKSPKHSTDTKFTDLLKTTREFISHKGCGLKKPPPHKRAAKAEEKKRSPEKMKPKAMPKVKVVKVKEFDAPPRSFRENTLEEGSQVLTPSENSSFSFAPSVVKPELNSKYRFDAELATSLALANKCIKEIHRTPHRPFYTSSEETKTNTSTPARNITPHGNHSAALSLSNNEVKTISI